MVYIVVYLVLCNFLVFTNIEWIDVPWKYQQNDLLSRNICNKTFAALTQFSTWGRCCYEADMCHRIGLKTALNVRQCLNNEIVYIEAGKWPLHSRIKKSQLKFWTYIGEYTEQYPNSAIAKVLQLAHTNSISYVRYYENLKLTHTDPVSCQKSVVL